MNMHRIAGCFIGMLALTVAARAQDPVADFYKGKQIRIIVASGPGGGYDLYARYLARHFSRHVPGNPTIIVQNMPGAGGITSANYIYNRAEQDGLTIGVIQGTLTYRQLGAAHGVQFDMRKFGWLGSANITTNTCVFSKRAGIANAGDLLTKPVTIGSSGGSTEFAPNLLNSLVGTKFQIVKGYHSTNTMLPAIERGEVDGMCGWGWDSARVVGRDYFSRGVLSVGLECGNERDPELAARGVPFMMDIVKDDENKKILRFLFSYQVYIRPFITPPGVPADRLKALQDAFAATLKDPQFLAEAQKGGVEIRYASPERVNAALSEVFDAPKALQDRALEELRKAGWEGLGR